MPCLNVSVSRKLTSNLVVTIARVCTLFGIEDSNYYSLVYNEKYLTKDIGENKENKQLKKC